MDSELIAEVVWVQTELVVLCQCIDVTIDGAEVAATRSGPMNHVVNAANTAVAKDDERSNEHGANGKLLPAQRRRLDGLWTYTAVGWEGLDA